MFKTIVLVHVDLFKISSYRRARRGGRDDRFRDDRVGQFTKWHSFTPSITHKYLGTSPKSPNNQILKSVFPSVLLPFSPIHSINDIFVFL